MIVLSKPQILMMHKSLIEETGGLDGIRDENLLDSAVNAPFQKFDCQDLFPTVSNIVQIGKRKQEFIIRWKQYEIFIDNWYAGRLYGWKKKQEKISLWY